MEAPGLIGASFLFVCLLCHLVVLCLVLVLFVGECCCFVWFRGDVLCVCVCWGFLVRTLEINSFWSFERKYVSVSSLALAGPGCLCSMSVLPQTSTQ